jgi:hypothetical protein
VRDVCHHKLSMIMAVHQIGRSGGFFTDRRDGAASENFVELGSDVGKLLLISNLGNLFRSATRSRSSQARRWHVHVKKGPPISRIMLSLGGASLHSL